MKRRLALILVFLIMLPIQMVLSAEPEPPENETNTTPTDNSEENTAPADIEDNGDNEGAVIQGGLVIEEDNQVPPDATPGNDRFIPTIQISEDLSVSFPVDI